MPPDYCAEDVKRHDPDRYLLTVLSPPAKRFALNALFAFNHEIAKTREVVTETQLGLIRLQWWRDAIAAIYEQGQVPRHQVIEPLAAAIAQYNLPREAFDNLVYAREFDLEDRLPASFAGLCHYADFTATPLLSLALLILGDDVPPAVVKDAATAYALTGLLRALPVHLRQRRCYLPEDALQAAGLSAGGLYAGEGIDRLPEIVKPVIDHAAALAKTVAAQKNPAIFLRRLNRLTQMYVRQIESAGYQPLDPRLRIPPFLKEIRIIFA